MLKSFRPRLACHIAIMSHAPCSSLLLCCFAVFAQDWTVCGLESAFDGEAAEVR